MRTAARAGALAHLQAMVVKAPPQRASRTRNRQGSRPSHRWGFRRWSCEWCERTARTARCSQDSHRHDSSTGALRHSPRFALLGRSIRCRNKQSSGTLIWVFATGCMRPSQN